MKKQILFSALIVTGIVSCTSSPEIRPAAPVEGYELVWHDEFDQGTELSDQWTHEVKPSGWVNNELQNYVDRERQGRKVTELVDGKLQIHCFQDGDSVFSGRVYAMRQQGWLYGYFEARIKLPQGRGTWPAFWMMPVRGKGRWPACGEIDIMEEVGYNPDYVVSTIHCEAYNHVKGTQKTKEMLLPGAESEFHVYSCEWTPERLTFFVDGEEFSAFENDGRGDRSTWPYDYAFYPILNLAWGGGWGGQQGVDETALPATMEVDYLRVFQKKAAE